MFCIVFGFSKFVWFANGTKQAIFRPGYEEEHNSTYDGHNHIPFYAVLLWTDVFGIIIGVFITLIGSRHDRGFYNDCNPFKDPIYYVSHNQLVIANLDFIGSD